MNIVLILTDSHKQEIETPTEHNETGWVVLSQTTKRSNTFTQ